MNKNFKKLEQTLWYLESKMWDAWDDFFNFYEEHKDVLGVKYGKCHWLECQNTETCYNEYYQVKISDEKDN